MLPFSGFFSNSLTCKEFASSINDRLFLNSVSQGKIYERERKENHPTTASLPRWPLIEILSKPFTA